MDIGDLVAMEAQLEKIADTPISSDYARYMESKGISCKTYLDGSCKLLRNGHRRSLKTLSLALRDEIETNIEKSSLGRRAKAFVIAMICGDRSFMSSGCRRIPHIGSQRNACRYSRGCGALGSFTFESSGRI